MYIPSRISRRALGPRGETEIARTTWALERLLRVTRARQVASTVAPTDFVDRPSRFKDARSAIFDRLGRPNWLERGQRSDFDRSEVDFGSPEG